MSSRESVYTKGKWADLSFLWEIVEMTYRILFFTKNIMGLETSDRTVSFTKIFIDYGYMITKYILRFATGFPQI